MKRLKSLHKAEAYLEIKLASTMQSFCEYTLRLNIFAIKALYRYSTGLYIGLRKYWKFEAKMEQIIAIVTKPSVSC